jgi:LysR family transcriptional regulator, glycine cleavage system transcriptional activator
MVLELPPETIVPLCSPALAHGDHPIRSVADLRHHALIHSEGCLVGWRDWMRQHRKTLLDITRGPRFDRSFMAISAAADGMGVCLESLLLVQRELETGRLVAPLGLDGLRVQGYTLNLLKSRADLPKLRSFQDWLFAELEA